MSKKNNSSDAALHSEVVEVESLAAGGEGVSHLRDGRVVFIPQSAPGDRLRILLRGERKRFARGEIQEILQPSSQRTAPRCHHFGVCGGCEWQHIAYDVQLEAKKQIICDAITRIAKLPLPKTIEILPCDSPYGYRQRMRPRVEGGRAGFRKRGAHTICDVDECPVLVPELEKLFLEKKSSMLKQPGDWDLAVNSHKQSWSSPTRAHKQNGSLTYQVGTDAMRVSTGVFTQSNAILFETLAKEVAHSAGTGHSALELYAGAGFLTLGLADRFERMIAVESNRACREKPSP